MQINNYGPGNLEFISKFDLITYNVYSTTKKVQYIIKRSALKFKYKKTYVADLRRALDNIPIKIYFFYSLIFTLLTIVKSNRENGLF